MRLICGLVDFSFIILICLQKQTLSLLVIFLQPHLLGGAASLFGPLEVTSVFQLSFLKACLTLNFRSWVSSFDFLPGAWPDPWSFRGCPCRALEGAVPPASVQDFNSNCGQAASLPSVLPPLSGSPSTKQPFLPSLIFPSMPQETCLEKKRKRKKTHLASVLTPLNLPPPLHCQDFLDNIYSGVLTPARVMSHVPVPGSSCLFPQGSCLWPCEPFVLGHRLLLPESLLPLTSRTLHPRGSACFSELPLFISKQSGCHSPWKAALLTTVPPERLWFLISFYLSLGKYLLFTVKS